MSGSAPSVLVCGGHRSSVERAALRGLRTGGQVVVGWTGRGEAPALPGVEVLPLFPLPPPYAWNRALARATGPRVVLVTASAGLPASVVAREPLLADGGLDQALGRLAPLEAALRLRSRSFSIRLARRLLRPRPAILSPMRHLAALPADLPVDRRALRPLAASHRTKTHFLYAAEDSLLHLYVNPHERLRRSVAERERIRAGAPAGAVPVLLAVREGRDCMWVLEERVDGEHVAGPPAAWFPDVADWVMALGGPPGPRLDSDPSWSAHAVQALAATPIEHRDRVHVALRRVGALAAQHTHGDLQPRNILRTAKGFAAVDWEGAWLRGLPGLDLLFLALLSAGEGFDTAVLLSLAHGEDPRGLPVRARLAAVGVGPSVLPDLLLACLAGWTLGEQRRLRRLGAPPAPPSIAGLWDVVAP